MAMRDPEAADAVRSRILDWVPNAGTGNSPLDWVVRGSAASGKSHLLAQLYQDIAQAGVAKPILVAPPISSQDSAGAALVQIGEQLRSHGLINGEFESLREMCPWRDKLERVGNWLEVHASSIVVICDAPGDWAPTNREDGYSPRHAEAVKALIGQTAGLRRIVSGSGELNSRRYWQGRLDPSATTRAAFSMSMVASEWGLEITQKHPDILSYMPLDARLLVAIGSLDPKALKRQLKARRITSELLGVLERHLQTQRSVLPKVWRLATLLRRPFTADALDDIGAQGLSSEEKKILFNCLLDRRGKNFSMHRYVSVYAQEHIYISERSIEQAHSKLAHYFVNRKCDDTILSDSMEAYHHGLEGGVIDHVKPMFTDQLNARGRMLSKQKKYDDAAMVFSESMKWDDEDDYAHHYYAYNLDFVGKKSPEVDKNYKAATDIDPKNIWWWSRRINFLITVGRISDAESAWEEARAQFAHRQDAEYYDGLHRWVSRLLVEVGRLDFAESVLKDVSDVHRGKPHFRAVENYLISMRSAQARRAVFPLGIAPETWWAAPHLHQSVNDLGERLIRWLPGRVDECNTDHVVLTVAKPATSDAPPVYGILSMKRREFEIAWKHEPGDSLAAGRYVELAYYDSGSGSERLLVRAYPDEAWDEKDLPSLDPPDTARYLRQRGLLT